MSEQVVEDQETKILNSFYISDLQKVKKGFAQEDYRMAIKAFLNENEITNADKFNFQKIRALYREFCANFYENRIT